jgi:hypothetical protein
MPYEITLENIPVGVARSASRGGGTVQVQTMYFGSSEDGESFIDQLEGFPDEILRRLPESANLRAFDIRHMLAIISEDRTATVYVNGEIQLVGTVQPKRAFGAGEPVFKDDITDIQRVSIEGVTIPKEAGVLFVFSFGWRKGLFFDFGPLGPQGQARDYDLDLAFGQYFAHVMFQELFRIAEPQWDCLFAQQWFPFRCLKSDQIKELLAYAKEGWPLDDLLEKIVSSLTTELDAFMTQWSGCSVFSDHLTVLSQAIERFRSLDYISCASIIFPRIEGLLRSFHRSKEETSKPSQTTLAASAVNLNTAARHGRCLLLPERFECYLNEVYFAAFDPHDPKIVVSRNSVAHGVVSAEELSAKSAAIGLMIVQQILYYAQPLGPSPSSGLKVSVPPGL